MISLHKAIEDDELYCSVCDKKIKRPTAPRSHIPKYGDYFELFDKHMCEEISDTCSVPHGIGERDPCSKPVYKKRAEERESETFPDPNPLFTSNLTPELSSEFCSGFSSNPKE
jgi:hypothetical protein